MRPATRVDWLLARPRRSYGFSPLLRRVGLLLSLVLAGTASAHDLRVFSVGVQDYENYLPYSEHKDGNYRGLSRDILDAFAKQHGYRFEYKGLPLKRRDAIFLQGGLDLSFPDNPNWLTRHKQGRSISYAPMLEFTDGRLVRPADLGLPLTRVRVLGIPLGFTPYPYKQRVAAGQLRIEESARYDKLYEKLLRGHVDAA
jgi:polar amino acid transport system substrate-binding protein